MDPDKALADAREAASDMVGLVFGLSDDEKCEKADKLQDAFMDLDDWLSKGGFPPDAWAGQVRKTTALLNEKIAQNDKLVSLVRLVAATDVTSADAVYALMSLVERARELTDPNE